MILPRICGAAACDCHRFGDDSLLVAAALLPLQPLADCLVTALVMLSPVRRANSVAKSYAFWLLMFRLITSGSGGKAYAALAVVALAAARRAWSRSATMSAAVSSPIDRRTTSGPAPALRSCSSSS
jgi:hypothetical protein